MTYEKMLVEFQLFVEEQVDNMSIEDFKTIDLLLGAIKKQIPKKPRETRCALMCANCGNKIAEKGCKKN